MKGGIFLSSSYKKLVKTIQRNWKIFFVVIVLTTISGYLLASHGLTKHYHTITELYIESLDEETDAQKATTCQLLFTSPQMYNTINLQLQQGFTYAEYDEMLTVEQVNGTRMLRITVDCDTSSVSYQLSEIILRVIPVVIHNYGEEASYTVMRNPVEPSDPVFPDENLFIIAGALVGFVISLIGIVIIWKLDNTITADDELSEAYDIDILGEIPDFDNEVDYLGR